MKKTIAILLTALMVVAMFCVPASAADATIELVEKSNDGSTAVYDIVVANNPGIGVASLRVAASWLNSTDTYKAAIKGSKTTMFATTTFGFTSAGVNILLEGDENVTENGTIATLTVNLADAPAGATIDLFITEVYAYDADIPGLILDVELAVLQVGDAEELGVDVRRLLVVAAVDPRPLRAERQRIRDRQLVHLVAVVVLEREVLRRDLDVLDRDHRRAARPGRRPHSCPAG